MKKEKERLEIEDLIKKYPACFEMLGGITYALNKIEVSLITILTIFFSREDTTQTKNIIFNDALFDNRIFSNFENKLNLFKKIIEHLNVLTKGKSQKFNKNKWLQIYKDIKEIQKLRNDLNHHFPCFSKKGLVLSTRKKSRELLVDKKSGKSGSLKFTTFELQNIKKALNNADRISRELFLFISETRSLFVSN